MSTVRTNRNHAPSERSVRLATAGVVASYIHEISGRPRARDLRAAAAPSSAERGDAHGHSPVSTCESSGRARRAYRSWTPAVTKARDLRPLAG
jgi:hypothetical protein